MKHSNISIFIPHAGCPHQCSFCNQRTISGTVNPPTGEEVYYILKNVQIADKSNTEIAFFGGSFTAINRDYMIELLEVARRFIGEDGFSGIRISTRPDCINEDILKLLKSYGVTAIELGAQSMDDTVLLKNDRGHTSADVIAASSLIKQFGFSLGLQMMVGLYGDSIDSLHNTRDKIIEIKPDTVRIYPTVVLIDTKLANLLKLVEYQCMPLDEAVDICSDLLMNFEQNSIRVIKLGLHASCEVEQQMVGGIYHPAFRELCESKIYLKSAISKLSELNIKDATVYVSPKSISKMIGQKRNNIECLAKLGFNIQVKSDNTLSNYQIRVEHTSKTKGC